MEIKSREKENLVDEVIVPEISYWIGLTDFAQEGQFVWVKSYEKTNYTHWFPSEPTSHVDEDCVFKTLVQDREGWYDYACDRTAAIGTNLHALCEADNSFLRVTSEV